MPVQFQKARGLCISFLMYPTAVSWYIHTFITNEKSNFLCIVHGIIFLLINYQNHDNRYSKQRLRLL
jgi:hypothetical protein